MKILQNGIKIVTVIFAIGTGYLKDVAPPEDNGKAVAFGMAFLSCIFAYLLIYALAKSQKDKFKRRWILMAVMLFLTAFGLFYFYFLTIENTTFSCSPDNPITIVGTLTPEYQDKLKNKYQNNMCKLIENTGGYSNYQRLSIPGSISQARMKLRVYYIFFVLLLVSSIFCLTDGAIGEKTGKSPASSSKKDKTKDTASKGKQTVDEEVDNK